MKCWSHWSQNNDHAIDRVPSLFCTNLYISLILSNEFSLKASSEEPDIYTIGSCTQLSILISVLTGSLLLWLKLANMLKKHSCAAGKVWSSSLGADRIFFCLTPLTGKEKLRVCYMFRPFLRPLLGIYRRNSNLNKPALYWTEVYFVK